jgi:hypothetical protein
MLPIGGHRRRLDVDGIARAMRGVQPHLADDEGIVATALGLEADGRRRRVAILTDRRLLVAALRGGAPRELDADATVGRFDPDGDLLTFSGEDEVILRRVDPRAGRHLLRLLASRRPSGAARPDEPGTVRIVG